MSQFNKRFEIVHSEKLALVNSVMVLRDRETGVLYLFAQSGYAGGLTPLLDSEGKPMKD